MEFLSIKDRKPTFKVHDKKKGLLMLAIYMWWLYVVWIIIRYKCVIYIYIYNWWDIEIVG